MKSIFAKSSELGVNDIVIGMAHRGKMNVLANLLDYPAEDLVTKIMHKCDMPSEYYNRVDDIASHIGISLK